VTALRVTTAAQAAARDRAAIGAGIASFDLMRQAGTVAAAVILREYGDRLAHGVALHAGSGNNGGDAYIVAAQLARSGIAVRLHAAAPPATPDAQRAAALATPALVHGEPTGRERVVVDGLLGTGSSGPLREHIAAACTRVALARDAGAVVVALDMPTGLDATTGAIADGSVPAHATICFGTLKRGVLLQRAHAGRVWLADIGLDGFADGDDDAWRWADVRTRRDLLPPMSWDTHKAQRGRIAIAGGDTGMAGAVVLACRGALAAGAGVVHAVVDEPSIAALQALVPQALAQRWPLQASSRRADTPTTPSENRSVAGEARRFDALAIGPGLGRARHSSQLLQRLVDMHRRTPLVLDADALWIAADAAHTLGTDAASLIRHWTRDTTDVVCTPHLGEFSRLLGMPLPDDVQERLALLSQFAVRSGATVLLKGAPTFVATPDGAPTWVVPHGTAMLATGGSGDLLTGIITALLGQGCPAATAAVLGATVHGLAAEHATLHLGGVRGGTLEQVLRAMPQAWQAMTAAPPLPPGVLADLPPVAHS
jgi:NAD(P)H-hydrate epimerase